jgi:hypothetical protein
LVAAVTLSLVFRAKSGKVFHIILLSHDLFHFPRLSLTFKTGKVLDVVYLMQVHVIFVFAFLFGK